MPATVSLWNAPVLALDIAFLAWTVIALVKSMKVLDQRGQDAKLSMYKQLATTLFIFVVVWTLLFGFEVGVKRKLIDLPWSLNWLIHSFWHICYFGMLSTIAVIWRPSAMSDQLSYSFQLATSEEEADDFDDIVIDDDDIDGVQMVRIEEEEVDQDLDR